MDLLLYFAFVAVAIGGIVLLLNRLGLGKRTRYTEEVARTHLALAYPEEAPIDTIVAEGTVLFALPGDRIAIVRSMGLHPLISVLARPDIREIDDDGSSVTLRTREFTDPTICLQAEDSAALKVWLNDKLG